jgi:hypothetical protein
VVVVAITVEEQEIQAAAAQVTSVELQTEQCRTVSEQATGE